MNYDKNYCEEKEISTSKLNGAQRTLYYVAENMKMEKSISEEGYRHFQMAIKALEQEEPVLDKIRAEIEETYINLTYEENHKVGGSWGLRKALEIIDKYKAKSENKE